MSLDVYLKSPEPVKSCSTGIYVRENGATRELSYEEACKMYPDAEIRLSIQESCNHYTANITHNMASMAEAAGIYEYIWHPEDVDITTAGQLINPLREGLHKLKSDPDKFKKYNPRNGWGSYDVLVKFVEDYLDACYKHPDAIIITDC